MNNPIALLPGTHRITRIALGAVAACGLLASAAAFAQSTSGTVFGHAPAGDQVVARSTTTGTQRTVHVAADGRYSLRSLPTGVYDVTLEQDGKMIVRHPKVPVVVGRGVKVDFDCAQGNCGKAANPS